MPGKLEPARWAGFPGPIVTPVKSGSEAWVIGPIQPPIWPQSLSLFLVTTLRVEGTELVVDGVGHREVYVPGVFVAPVSEAKGLKTGAAVMMQRTPGMTMSASFGRIVGQKTTEGVTTYDVKYAFGGSVSDAEVSANHVLPIDGTLRIGALATFEVDGHKTVGRYLAPGNKKGDSWVVGVKTPVEKANVKPLPLPVLKKGAKVKVATVTVSGSVTPYTLLENATVIEVLDGGVQYKVKSAADATFGDKESIVDMSEVFAM